uniref:Ig-like domain-containing protein n=1 Tax=Xenopus tropicalis TaxID=8364 RepID=A0A803JWV2_XENTR
MALGMPRLSLVTFCMFGIYCAGASEEPCYGNVGDREVYAPYGSWALLNCTHNCTKVDWETRLIQKNRTKGPGWVSVEVKVGGYDIWRASDISCTVLSGREAVDNYITVIPYEIPRLVTLDMEDMLEEGKSYNVTCTVHGVAPIQNLRVTMLRGKEEIYNKTFKDDSRVGNITEPVTYQITAERSDNMEDFSCQATLALGTAIGNVTVPSANVPVRTFGASEEPCYGNIGDREVYAPFGDWTPLNCTHNCTLAAWESRLTKRNITKGPGWVSVEVGVGVTENEWGTSNISCTVLSGGEAVDNYVTVIPYKIPRLVTLDMEDMLEEGKSYIITCTVHGVAPIQNLRVTILRGKEEIYNKTFKDDSRVGNITEAVTYQITAERSDNMEDFSCQATLALGTVPGNKVRSSNIPVRTFGLPQAPYFNNTHWIKIGTKDTLSCVMPNASPPDNVTLTMLFDNTRLSVNKTKMADGTVEGRATIPPEYLLSINTYQARCKAELLGLSSEDSVDIHIYEPANINLTLSNTEVRLGETIRASCVLTNEHPDQYSVVIGLNGEDVCEDPKWDCNVTVKGTSPVANVTCKAFHKRNQGITYVTQQSVPVIGNNVWAFLCIVAFVFTGLLAMILVGTAALYLCRRKRKRDSYIVTQRRALRTPQCRTDSITS